MISCRYREANPGDEVDNGQRSGQGLTGGQLRPQTSFHVSMRVVWCTGDNGG